MLLPGIFNDTFEFGNLFFAEPWLNNRELHNIERKLYNSVGKNIMNTDIKETETGFEMIVDLPGFAKDEISIELKNDYLVISAEKTCCTETKNGADGKPENTECVSSEDSTVEKADATAADKNTKVPADRYLCRERYCDKRSRRYFIGKNVVKEEITASFKNGVLTVNIPKKAPEPTKNSFINIA